MTEHASQLVLQIAQYESCVVAFSGGVDSAVVAQAAKLALGDRSLAATGIGPALSLEELHSARQVAQAIGIRHLEIPTDEITRPGYIANAPDRCFHCKTSLYSLLRRIADREGMATIANGANADDLGDHRPGMQAADDFRVRSPLIELGLGKSDVRSLAMHWGLSIADKPASPCLASRVAYGLEVTPERLSQVEQAEALLRELGLRDFRVRIHPGELARIEAPLEELSRLVDPAIRAMVVERFTRLGLAYVTLDLAGFRSGSLNAVISAEALLNWKRDAH